MYRFFSLALLLVLLLGTIRGGATSLSRMVSISDVPAIGYAFWQSLIAAGILAVMAFRQTRKLPDLRARPGYYLLCGLVGTAIPNCIFFTAVKHISAGTMAVLLTLVPILTYFGALVTRMERIDAIRFGGILLGLLGAMLIALARVDGGFTVDGYVLFAMLCPLGYSIMGVYVGHRRVVGVHPFQLAAGTHVVAVLFLLPAALLTGQFHPLWLAPELPEALIVAHGVLAALAYSLFFKIVELAGVVFYSLSHYVIALTGLAWGWLLFGESHGALFWIAVGLILSGLTLVNIRQRFQPVRT